MVQQVFPERTFYLESQLASSVRDSVRLDDQCVWARAIDVSWPPPAQAGRGALLLRLLTAIASPRDIMGSERPRCVPVVALLAAI